MEQAPDDLAGGSIRSMPPWLAVVLVTGTSAAVLVLEILAGRLLAPYVGVSLETYTAIIGTVLTGIALGAAAGGWAADRMDPWRLLPALLGLGGALTIASIPIVRLVGRGLGSGAVGGGSIVLAGLAFAPPAAALSAVPPVVVKHRLRDLDRTGTTVGRLSAYGTAGAIVGTFLAGYVLVAFAAVTTLIVTVGVVVLAAAATLWVSARRPAGRVAVGVATAASLALVGVAAVDPRCDVQTAYYCVSIVPDPDRASGRVLVLDDLRHSYVDLDDPTHLEFWYVRRIADAIDVHAPTGPISVVSIGGGGMTVPRWIRATRPGSDQTVLEIDGELVDVAERRLGFEPGGDVRVVTGDGRLALRSMATDSVDVVIGDAFGSRAVPWHLTTREFVGEIARVLRPGGLYVVNVIDEPTQDFLRAAAATVGAALPDVAVVRSQQLLDGVAGNAVIAATDGELDVDWWDDRRTASGDGGGLVPDVTGFVDGADVLTDDFAPVDQLLSGSG